MNNTRRRALAVMSLALATALAGCSGSADSPGADTTDSEPIHLTYWTWVPGAADAVDTWNADHSDVQVDLELIQLGAEGGYAKMFQALQAGNAPCLANIEHRNLPSFIVEGGVMDIADYAGQYQDRFTPWLWNGNVYGDALYAIPNSSGPLALLYRTDIFDDAGISVPETWDDFRTAAEQLHESSPDTAMATLTINDSSFFAALAQQNGAQWFDTDGENWIVDIDSPESHEVADFWQGMIDDDLVDAAPTTNDAWYLQVQNDEVASWITANWGSALIEANAAETSGDWAAAPIPSWTADEPRSANWGGSSTAILDGCEHPAEAVEFAAWLQSDPESIQQLLAGGAGWPALADLSEVPAATAEEDFFGGQAVNEVFQEATTHIDDNWHWSPTTQSTLDFLADRLQDVANGETTLGDVLTATQEQAVQSLESKGLPVAEG